MGLVKNAHSLNMQVVRHAEATVFAASKEGGRSGRHRRADPRFSAPGDPSAGGPPPPGACPGPASAWRAIWV
jgi:hypothetical protein